MVLLQLLAIALIVGGFARLELHAQPEGAGYFYVSTPDGYPVPTLLQQGMTVRVRAVPRGCYELDRIEVTTGGETETYRAEEVLVELKDYMTEVTAYFRGYPEERCPYITIPTGAGGYVRLDKALLYLLLAPMASASAVLAVRGARARRHRFPPELSSLNLDGALQGRGLLDLLVLLNACRSIIEGDPALDQALAALRGGASPIRRLEAADLASYAPKISTAIVGLGGLAKTYPWILEYAYSRGLVPTSRGEAERIARRAARLVRQGRYEELAALLGDART
jgi:hypothetical protein